MHAINHHKTPAYITNQPTNQPTCIFVKASNRQHDANTDACRASSSSSSSSYSSYSYSSSFFSLPFFLWDKNNSNSSRR